MKQASLYIKSMLDASSEIKAKVSDRIWPIAATAGTDQWPFITFRHSSVGDAGTKDSKARIITAEILTVSRTALEAEELADMIMPAFYAHATDNETFDRFDVPDFVSESEEYAPDIDSFIVKTTVTFEYN